MKYIICAVKDTAAEMFGQPIFVRAPGQAVRSFTDEVNRQAEDNQYFKHPDDYELYQLGTFEDDTGKFDPLETPTRLIRGKDAKQPE